LTELLWLTCLNCILCMMDHRSPLQHQFVYELLLRYWNALLFVTHDFLVMLYGRQFIKIMPYLATFISFLWTTKRCKEINCINNHKCCTYLLQECEFLPIWDTNSCSTVLKEVRHIEVETEMHGTVKIKSIYWKVENKKIPFKITS
jgi:hypothetical protein